MNRNLALIGGAIVAATAFAVHQDGVVLKRVLTPNSTDTYKIEMKSVNSTPMGDATVNGTMKVVYKIGSLGEDGKADLEMVTSDMKFEFGGLAEMASGMMNDLPKTTTVKGKIDERNRITDMKMPGANMQMQMLMGNTQSNVGQSIEFPEGPVKVGDTWTVTIPKNEMAGMAESKLQAKLLKEADHNGVPAYQVTVTGSIPMKMDMAEMAKKNPEAAGGMAGMGSMILTGKNDVTINAIIEKSTGRTLEMTTTMKSKTNISGDQLPMTIDVDGNTTIKMTLQK
jgi:hypothetical protein